jgi:ABC-type polysaccharide/polyol phosphate export permease
VAFDLRGEHTSLGVLLADVRRSWPLVQVLARKEFLVRYRRASFGVAWALALPLLQATVLAVVLPKFVRFDTGSNYVLFVFAGTTAWTFFAGTLADGTGSIVAAQEISTRVYFPRLLLPLVTVLANLYALLPGVVVLVAASVLTGDFGPRALWVVPGVGMAALLAGSLAALFSGLHVYFRDVKYLVQAGLLVWFYLTPVIYPLSEVGGLRPWIEANPAAGVVQLFRAATVGADAGWGTSVAWSAAWSVATLAAAVALHRRHDRVFVDLL